MITRGGVQRPRPRQDVESAHARQADVQQDDVEGAILQERERLAGRHPRLDVMAGVFQQCGQRLTQPPVIIDDQDAAALGSMQSSIRELLRRSEYAWEAATGNRSVMPQGSSEGVT